jgi:hypothetical protein
VALASKNPLSENSGAGVEDPLEDALKASLEKEFDGVLTAAEIEDARAEARKKFAADAKKTAKQDLIEAEIYRLKTKTGDGFLDEEIFINIDLPPYADRLVVDGMIYFHNHAYKRKRHIVNSLRESIARMWDHEADIKGQSLAQKMGQYRVQNFKEVAGSRSLSAKGYAA